MSNKQKSSTKEKGDEKMAVLAKPTKKMIKLDFKESQKFVKEFNKNKVSAEFLDSCKKAGKLFKTGR